MVIVVGNGHGDSSSNPGRELRSKGMNLIILQLWVNIRAD